MTMTMPAQRDDPQEEAVLSAFSALDPVAETLAVLDESAGEYVDGPDRALAAKARKLRDEIRGFEPGVTFIGQVKAGKTTLVNAMIGWPGLLPADVNPWTSVVTSMHLAPRHHRGTMRAAFRFFSDEEWEALINQGGRIGQIASRAGADDEMAKVRAQLDTLREKSRQRLGQRFEMLLGQTHAYDKLDADLVKRYVSLGDNFWEAAGARRLDGRFADITKTADLWLQGPDLPVGLCIQDTPGVNDTFMIREQITLKGLRGSRLCVMVLSAQQALSSVDLGLIRLISNIRSRDVIIFVNRIDELASPARDVPRIRDSITKTLADLDGPKDVEVLFGSAFWAEHAVASTLDALGQDSAAALLNWAESEVHTVPNLASPREMIWALSGLPGLGQAMSERIVAGPAKQLIDGVRIALGNLEAGAAVLRRSRGTSLSDGSRLLQRSPDLLPRFDRIATEAADRLEARLSIALEKYDQRAEKAHRMFLDRATGELVKHLEEYGDQSVWSYDPTGLRMLLRGAYRVFTTSANKAAEDELQAVADEISTLVQEDGGMAHRIVPPPIPKADSPVALARTVALDLKGGWWSRLWRRRRGYEALAADFTRLIAEETAGMPVRLRSECVDTHVVALRRTLDDFIADQRDLFAGQVLPR